VVSESKRQYPRVMVKMAVSMKLANAEMIGAFTRDISEGGVYLKLESGIIPSLGDRVEVQVQGIPSGDAPWVNMEVVRVDEGGIGLKMLTD